MLRRLFSKVLTRSQSVPARPAMVESVEPRQLLAAAPIVTGVIADNRGEVQITLSRFVRNVNKNNVRFFTAGVDGVIGTSDDVRKTDIGVSFNTSNNRITVRGDTESNATYRVRLESNNLTTSDGTRLDGEFLGTFPSGNGTQGGNFNFVARRDRTSTQTVRMSTSLGVITLRMRGDVAPISATQFLDLANGGVLDGFFWTRSIPGFVIQGGSLQVTGDGAQANDIVGNNAPEFGQETPRVLTNIRGTLSFARGGAQLNASNQFFINLGNNSTGSTFNNLDVADGPTDAIFTPFAEVTSGIDVADAVAAKPAADLSSQIGTLGGQFATGVSDVPVNDAAQAQAGLNPNRDLIVARRVAVRMKLGALA